MLVQIQKQLIITARLRVQRLTTLWLHLSTKESTGAVSVGDGALVRQIQNVGAGRITATSNDAVNGSQLYQAYYNAGFNIQNNGKETSRINTHGKVNFVNGDEYRSCCKRW